MSGFRAFLKNDNFFMATQAENEKKRKQQQQVLKKPRSQMTMEQLKQVKREIQEEKIKMKIKKADRSIFESVEKSDNSRFGLERETAEERRKRQEEEDFQLLRRKLQKKKEKKVQQKKGKQLKQPVEEQTQKSSIAVVVQRQQQVDDSKRTVKSKEGAEDIVKENVDVDVNLKEIVKEKVDVNVNVNEKFKQREEKGTVREQSRKRKDEEDDNFDELFEALKTEDHHQKEQKKSKEQKVGNNKGLGLHRSIFKPKSTLVVAVPLPQQKDKAEKPKSSYQLQRERRQFDKKLKKQLAQQLNEDKKKNQNQGEGDDNKKNDNQQGQQKKEKKKKIKKANNYQKLDMKRRYKDRFVGGLRDNQRRYMRNGTLRPQYRTAQSQLQMEHSQIYNTYIHSLSRSLKVEVIMDSDDEQVELQEEERNIQLPSIGECTEERLTILIKEMFGFERFREGQYEVIMNIINQKSTIFVSQTASGKSLTYIISSLILAHQYKGMSIVISPLIALMLDQLQHLPIEVPAACISSLLNYEQRERILNLVKAGEVKLLFMTPQMLLTDMLFHLGQFPAINFVCIDEAHCLSQLSHNFRTSYMALAEIITNHINYRQSRPNILCLTATANTETIQSLSKKLHIKQIIKSSSTLNKNLYITITREIGPENKYRSLVEYLSQREVMKCQGVLIYCRSKWIIDKVFNYLSNSGICATVFHAGLTSKQKTKIIAEFKSKMIRIIVSTTALGMGLDFEHLDCIVHFNMAKSLESFVQEIGRAGRRQSRAYCQLFLDESDFFMERNYILADELEESSMGTIVGEIEKGCRASGLRKAKSRRQNKEPSKQEQEKQMQRVIKRASMMIEQMEDRQGQEQDDEQQLSNPFSEVDQVQENVDGNESSWSNFYYLRSKELSEKTYLREEALLGILMKLAELVNRHLHAQNSSEELEIMKIHPLSHEFLKLSFFKNNEQQLLKSQQHGEFFSKLVDVDQKDGKPKAKKVNGAYHIHLIEKCNQLHITPIQLITKVYEISNRYVMKVQFVNEVYVFSLKPMVRKQTNSQLQQVRLTQREIIGQLLDREFQKKVILQVNQLQRTSMTKLEVFYSLAFNYSQITVSQLIRKRLVIDRSSAIPNDNIMKQITKYFNTDLLSFYSELTQTEDEHEREMFLPTENIDSSEMVTVYEYVKLFFKHQYSNLRDINSRQEAMKKKEAILEQYKDGKVITRVFLGVNEEKSSRFIFGEHSYWRKFLKKKYFSLLKSVRQLIEKNRDDLLGC